MLGLRCLMLRLFVLIENSLYMLLVKVQLQTLLNTKKAATKMAIQMDGAGAVAETQHHIRTATLATSVVMILNAETTQFVALATLELQGEFGAGFKMRQCTHKIMHMHALLLYFDDGNWLAHGGRLLFYPML